MLLKRIGIGSIVLALGLGGFLYYQWLQFTKIPDWHPNRELTSENSVPQNSASLVENRERVIDKIRASLTEPYHEEVSVPRRPEESAFNSENLDHLSTTPSVSDEVGSLSRSIPPTNTPPVNSSVSQPKISSSQSQTNSAQAPTTTSRSSSSGEVRLSEQDLNDLFMGSLAAHSSGQQLLNMSQGVQTQIRGDRIQIGTVVNPSNAMTSLNSRQEQALNQALNRFPMFKNRNIYVGLEGSLQVQGGQLRLAPNAQVTVGNMKMPLREAAQMLNVPSQVLSQGIDLPVNEQSMQEIELRNGEVVIRNRR